MGKRTGKPRGRPSERMMPEPIRATPEEVARALFRAPPQASMAPEPVEAEEDGASPKR